MKSLDNQPKDIKIYTDDLRDVVTRAPSWLLKWGIAWILIFVCIVLSMASIIKYPDQITAIIKINAVDAPRAIYPKRSGSLVKLLAKNGQIVKRNDHLAWIESTADHQQILDLLEMCRKGRDNGNLRSLNFIAPAKLSLGELQESYYQIYLAYTAYRIDSDAGLSIKQKQIIEQSVAAEENHLTELFFEKSLLDKGDLLSKRKHKGHNLPDRTFISHIKNQNNDPGNNYNNALIERISADILISNDRLLNKHKKLAELTNQLSNQTYVFYRALNDFIRAVEEWKHNYVITATQNGKLIYTVMLQENQFVDTSIPVFQIDKGRTNYYCEMYINETEIAKVQPGQFVLIKLNSLPFQEYGILYGRVMKITEVPFPQSKYYTRVELLNDQSKLVKKLRPGMTGSADIITENISLLRRMTRNVFGKNFK